MLEVMIKDRSKDEGYTMVDIKVIEAEWSYSKVQS